MGWYDAFGGSPEKINVSSVTSNGGSATKNFGDAFVDIGKSMREAEGERVRQDRIASETALREDELDTKNTQWVQEQDNQDYLSQAFSSANPDELKQNYTLDDTNSVDAETVKKVDEHFQGKFNDEAIESSVTGDYKDMKSFVADNDTLVKNADGVTMSKIDKYFRDKDTTLATLNAKEKDIKQATALKKAQAVANKAKGKGTGVKTTTINSVVKAYLGADGDITEWNPDDQKAYGEMMPFLRDKIDTYNIKTEVALDMYLNPERFKFGKNDYTKIPEQKKKSEKKTNSWKDYQTK